MTKKIWKREPNLETAKAISKSTMLEHLEIEFTEFGDDFISARMPVNEKTIQPDGLLHGGANVVLAESLASIAAVLTVDSKTKTAVGVEINANHLRPVREGFVRGTTRPISIGRNLQVWETKIYREKDDKLSCISRMTIAIIDRPPA